MAESVAQIEEGAPAIFPLVFCDDHGLGPATLFDGIEPRALVAGQKRAAVLLQPVKEGSVAEQAVFHDLGVTGFELSRIERVEHVDIDQHETRLMECADK